ncbi:DUF3558 domain-containing protein [[Mycobacterium] wendilense]|uniref:DUF3558 domain-containing protein n=1 Tax=[Mycobacterium] wendilense TaxID=3064284 RepID=A0ABM9MB11_9MYCO|nr:DUF3558 domain-containing protein [Mycolicibacterium sp. MU0050]CAJ1580829.1 DUF3558 domain-containing protein [Mycolicibacterium sp. MU0050]
MSDSVRHLPSRVPAGRARHRVLGGVAAVAALAILTGCSATVDGNPVKAGAGPRNNESAETYPNLLKECDVLTSDVLAETVGAEPDAIQSTFVGAVCRWQASSQTGLVDITRFWFETGSLDNETRVAQELNYQIEERRVAGVASIVMRTGDANGGCGVASDAAGVVGWWVNPQAPGVDACEQAIALMELTLATSS